MKLLSEIYHEIWGDVSRAHSKGYTNDDWFDLSHLAWEQIELQIDEVIYSFTHLPKDGTEKPAPLPPTEVGVPSVWQVRKLNFKLTTKITPN